MGRIAVFSEGLRMSNFKTMLPSIWSGGSQLSLTGTGEELNMIESLSF